MKKAFALLTSIALVTTCLIAPAGAVQALEIDTQIMPAEILQPRNVVMTHTETVYVGNNTAEVTVSYTTRLEQSNSSGMLITGVLGGTIKKKRGWDSVTNLVIDPYGVEYSHNRQKAIVPITYEASLGEGYSTYSDYVTINLLG